MCSTLLTPVETGALKRCYILQDNTTCHCATNREGELYPRIVAHCKVTIIGAAFLLSRCIDFLAIMIVRAPVLPASCKIRVAMKECDPDSSNLKNSTAEGFDARPSANLAVIHDSL